MMSEKEDRIQLAKEVAENYSKKSTAVRQIIRKYPFISRRSAYRYLKN